MAKNKFRRWLEDVIAVKNWDDTTPDDLINDPTYDYELFYNKQPNEAKAMLKRNVDAHFTDIGKTVYHPTFSNESYYSGRKSIKNPKGIVGGTWSGDNKPRYTLSQSQVDNNWDVDRTIDYMSDAENEGVEIRMPNGRMVRYKNGYFNKVLPEIIVKPKKK